MATEDIPTTGEWVDRRTLNLINELLIEVERTASLVEERFGIVVSPRPDLTLVRDDGEGGENDG
jgi:hypothetical protein